MVSGTGPFSTQATALLSHRKSGATTPSTFTRALVVLRNSSNDLTPLLNSHTRNQVFPLTTSPWTYSLSCACLKSPMSRFDVWRPGTHEPLAPPILHTNKCTRAEDTLTWQQQEDLSKNKVSESTVCYCLFHLCPAPRHLPINPGFHSLPQPHSFTTQPLTPHLQSRRCTGRAAKFVPLNLEALATEPQASIESHAESFEHLQARDATPEVPDKPRVGDQPPKSAQASQPHDVSAKNPRSSRNKRKPNNTHKPKNMVARSPPTGAYVPPHLRKRTAAPGSTNDVRLGNHIALDSPQTSDKSQLEKLAAEASSTQVLSQQQTPLSPPKTVEGSSSNAIAEVSPYVHPV